MINYFKTLGVSMDAEEYIIRAARAAILKRHHPDIDKSAAAAERTRHINEAYAALRSAEGRRKHRADLLAWLEAERRKEGAARHRERADSFGSDRRHTSHDAPPPRQEEAGTRAAPSVMLWLALLVVGYASFEVFSTLKQVTSPENATAGGSEAQERDSARMASTDPRASHLRYETVEAYESNGQRLIRSVDYPTLEAFNAARSRRGEKPVDTTVASQSGRSVEP